MAVFLLTFIACISTTVLVMASSPSKCFFCIGIDSNCIGNKTNLPVMDCETFEVSTPDAQPPTFPLQFINSKEILEELKAKVHINISISTKMVCLKYTFDHEDFPRDTRGIVRTCAPEKIMQQDVCHWGNSFISLLNADPGDCSTCNEPYCNAGSGFKSYIYVFSALLLLCKSIIAY